MLVLLHIQQGSFAPFHNSTKPSTTLTSSNHALAASANNSGFCRFHGCLNSGCVTAFVSPCFCNKREIFLNLSAFWGWSVVGKRTALPAVTIEVGERYGEPYGELGTHRVSAIERHSERLGEVVAGTMSAPSINHGATGRGMLDSILLLVHRP